MQSENRERKNRITKSHNIVWLTAGLLTVLVIATVSVVGTCIYNYAHRTDCQISLFNGQVTETASNVGKAASQRAVSPVVRSEAVQYSGAQAKQQADKSAFEVKDTEHVWKTVTAIELFEAEYKNADGNVTVKSEDGNKVIAPGTEGSYTFSLKNTSSSSADYKIWVEAKLSSDMSGVPIQTRMSSDSGWLLGNKDSWKNAEDLDGVATEKSIGAGKTAEYTIDWQWPFERGEDETDTGYGNASVNQEMSYTVTIYTMTSAAAGSGDQTNQGNFLNRVKTGDTAHIFAWAAVLIVSAGAIFLLFLLRKRKNDGANE